MNKVTAEQRRRQVATRAANDAARAAVIAEDVSDLLAHGENPQRVWARVGFRTFEAWTAWARRWGYRDLLARTADPSYPPREQPHGFDIRRTIRAPERRNYAEHYPHQNSRRTA